MQSSFGHLILISNRRNEVYRGTYKEKTSIFKYHNDNSNEVNIMNFLQRKIEGIPIVYYHSTIPQISPSGRYFNELIIMSEIEGKVMGGLRCNSETETNILNINVGERKN